MNEDPKTKIKEVERPMKELAEDGSVAESEVGDASKSCPGACGAAADDLRRESDEAHESLQAAEISRRLIARSPDRIFLQDRDLRYTWFSHDDLFGICSSDMLGKTHSDFFSPAEATRLEEIQRPVMEAGVGSRVETHLSRNGSEHYFDIFFEPWRNEAGEIDGLAGYVRDITERKLAEKEILKMTRAVETTPTAVVLTDLDGRIEYVNPGLMETAGFDDASEVLGRSVFEFTDEEGRGKLDEEIIPALNSLGKWRGEIPVKVKRGQSYIAEMICALVKDDYGKPSYYLANFYNITDRKRAEEALLLDEARMEALLLLNQMDDASLQEITDFALEAAVKLTNSQAGYLAILNPGEKTVMMQSWSRNAVPDCKKDDRRIYPWDAPGPWSEAWRQKKTIITNQRPIGSREELPSSAEILRDMNVPVFDKGEIVAVVGVANKEEDYDDADVRQLALLMSGMWKLIQRRKSEEELRRSDRLLQGVAQATNYLLTPDPRAINKALSILGEATEADRAYIMENRDSETGERLHSQLLEWSRDGVSSHLGDPLLKDVPYQSLSPGWYEHLCSGRHVQSLASEVQGPGRDLLERLAGRSLLLVPLFINGRFAASIGFCDCQRERRWTDSEIAILKAAAGSIGEAMARRSAEEALGESQRMLSTLMSNLPGMAYRRKNDPAWAMEFVSHGCLELTGRQPADLVGNRAISYARIIHEDDREYVWGEVQEAVAEKRAFQLTYRIRTPSGTKWVWEQGQGIFSASGELLALEGFINDITERKLAEEALKRTQDELERRVRERTAWLLRANEALHKEMVMHKKTERELRLAQQAADAASRAKSQFLANMSHEIRTPMNAVIGLAGLLLDTGITPEQRDLVETIRSSGDALMAIINDILDFSKIDEGKMALERQPFRLQECLESSLNMVAAKAAEKGLHVTYSVHDEVPEVLQGDATRLRQVLANLLSNAVKFTEKGSVTVTVSPGKESDLIHFAIQDTGIGISQEDMSKLFLSFSQVDASTSRKYGGTGLGLAISRRLVELMGGRIWAESVLGQGSTFHFTIKALASAAPSPTWQGKRIVAVVSNQACRESLARHAHSWGMQIQSLFSAAGAGEIDPSSFDVAVVDTEVPAAEELIAELQKRLPVITLSPLGQRIAGKLSLAKPIKHSQLRAAMQEVFRSRALQAATTSLAPASRRDLNILLAEDNAVNQKVALLMLKRLGYQADVVANGREVLQAIKQRPYDVILMDIQMPEMDGLQAAKIIRQMSLDKQPQIMAMTAYALQGDRERCLAAGMDGYISKPVQIEELSSALDSIGRTAKDG